MSSRVLVKRPLVAELSIASFVGVIQASGVVKVMRDASSQVQVRVVYLL